MPLNVRRFSASAAFTFLGFVCAAAQTAAPPAAGSPATTPPPQQQQQTAANIVSAPRAVAAPTSAEIMRERISKAKAFIAVRNFNAAIYELENIRRETGDQTVHGVVNVLLMNSYLEQSDYKRAQEFLKELYNQPKNGKPIPSAHYFTVAGQVVKGARNQLERYKSLGLTVSDRNLPLEASVDIDKMRETLEMVVEHSKTIGADKTKTANAMALLEEATNTRSNLAKDDYDAKRWKDETGDAREQLTSSRSVITNAVVDSPPETAIAPSSSTIASTNPAASTNAVSPNPVSSNPPANPVAANPKPSSETATIFKPVANETSAVKSNVSETKPNVETVSKTVTANDIEKPNDTEKSNETPPPPTTQTNDAPKVEQAPVTNTANSETAPNNAPPGSENNQNANQTENNSEKSAENQNAAPTSDNSPVNVGSLVTYATSQAKPQYPLAAKNMRMTGVVKVEVLVNENGEVAQVQTASGPAMLQRAASDAVKKWKFKPFVRGGQPVKASGFVNFNFSL